MCSPYCYFIVTVSVSRTVSDIFNNSSFNGIFGKIVGGGASKEVILNLISAKCTSCLLYASEALPFNSLQLKSLGLPHFFQSV